MTHPARIGLLILIGLGLQLFINSSPLVKPQAHAGPATSAWNDPEQLFVEALKLAETNDRAGVNKRLDEAGLLWTKRGETERAARARLQIGDLYRNDKRFNESLSQYRQTLLIPGLSPSLKALTYDSIGQIYAELYQPELSLRNYLKALNLARQHKDHAVEAQVQLNLASLSGKKGDFSRAMDLAQRAVNASTKANDDKTLSFSLGFLGQMELKNGLTEKGHQDLDRALFLFRQNNDLPSQIKTLCFLSGFNLSSGQTSLAKEQAESALRVAADLFRRATTDSQRVGINALRWPCWLALARAQRASQQLQDARKSYLMAVSGTTLAYWMVYASTERSALGFAEERQPPYRELIDLHVELGQIDEAYNTYQYAKMRTLSGFIRGRELIGFRSDVDDKSNALSASVVALRTKLLSPALNKEQRENLEQELAEAEDELEERRLRIELNHPRRLVFSKLATVDQLQNQILSDDESILETCLGPERSFSWLISRGAVHFEILPGRKQIEDKARQYVNDLSVAPSNLHLQSRLAKQRTTADELFTMLHGKMASQLRAGSKLIVIPDGLLNLVPYESLVNNGRYLIEDYQISYLPSANLLELLRRASSKSASDGDSQLDLLAFGDPVFQQRANISLTRNVRVNSAKVNRQASDWDMSNLSRLPRTKDEVEYIGSLIPKERKRLYFGKDSTEKAFKQEPLSKYKWIHLATHSLINDQDPGRSAVVLALDESSDEDGFLRATEVADLSLNCDLVILSGCETGRGQLLSGEGIIGLSRSFFIAGARSVVVSLWAVSDISTAQLMKDFYQQLVNKAAKPAALREAKLRMLHGGSETRHPYYWAPFVIIGAP